jgi:hypothetical protein
MTTVANLYVDQGTDFITVLNLFTDSGDQFDITTQQFQCDVKKMYSSALEFSATIIVEPEGQTGMLELQIDAEDTANTAPGKYNYDIIMINQTGQKEKILEGLLFLLPTVTRA